MEHSTLEELEDVFAQQLMDNKTLLFYMEPFITIDREGFTAIEFKVKTIKATDLEKLKGYKFEKSGHRIPRIFKEITYGRS